MAGTERKTFITLLSVNIAVFVAVRLSAYSGIDLLTALALPAGWGPWAHRPWTAITYMLTQYDALHLIFNMLWLATFYMAARRIPAAQPHLLAVAYGIGGIVTAVAFVSVGSGVLVGSSAGVLAYAAAVAVLARGVRIDMVLFGSVPLSVLASVAIALTLVGAPSPVSHAVGALSGVAVALAPRLVKPFTRGGRRARLEAKVLKHGFKSLTVAERRRLFNLSHHKKL